MYNRILKRPMFKSGGSSNEAQGTGITSPYDTPRKRYNIGTTFEDIYSQMREKTKDPRGDFSYAAQGFSELANPYKESGEAKTIGEMLYAGAQGVRGSKEKASELERTGELAVLSSQGERLSAAEAHRRKLAEIREAGKFKSDEYLKKTPRDRQIIDEKNILAKTVTDPTGFVATFLDRIASGTVDARFASGAADVIPTNLFKKTDKGYGFEETSLTVDRVWWDPVRGLWLVFEDTDGNGRANGEAIYESVNVEDALKIFKGGEYDKKSKNSSDDLAEPEETKKKVVKKGTTKEEMEEAAKETTEKIKERFTWKGDVQGDNPYKRDELVTDFDETQKIVYKRAKGGRVGAAEGYSPLGVTISEPDTDVTELEELNAWWKSQLNSKDITDEG